MWASLLEKAYAKAHGSYRSISGGQIAEALLDLTGAPTFQVSLDRRDFDSEKLWHSARVVLRVSRAEKIQKGELKRHASL